MEKTYTGMLVQSDAGHDKGSFYVVIAESDRELFVANGRERSCTAPKRKNKKHIHPVTATQDTEIQQRLRAGEAVREEEIRNLIRSYEREYGTCQKQMSSKSKAQ